MKVSPDHVLRIALDSGFSSNETFTRAFVRRFQISPSEFRRVLRDYRAAVDDMLGSETFAGFAEDTPLTLRFDMRKHPVSVVRTRARHLLFVRRRGYENLLAPGERLESLWADVLEYAGENGIRHVADAVIGLTQDDPYVAEDRQIRFDACIEVAGPIPAAHGTAVFACPPSG